MSSFGFNCGHGFGFRVRVWGIGFVRVSIWALGIGAL